MSKGNQDLVIINNLFRFNEETHETRPSLMVKLPKIIMYQVMISILKIQCIIQVIEIMCINMKTLKDIIREIHGIMITQGIKVGTMHLKIIMLQEMCCLLLILIFIMKY